MVLVHLLTNYPTGFRLSDLLRELIDCSDYAERDRVERAVAELVRIGLLFRAETLILPTRAAMRAYEVLEND